MHQPRLKERRTGYVQQSFGARNQHANLLVVLGIAGSGENKAAQQCRMKLGNSIGSPSCDRDGFVGRLKRGTEIARAIERAEKLLGPGRVRYVHPDCGFWMLKRSIADGKINALVEGRNLYEGRASRA